VRAKFQQAKCSGVTNYDFSTFDENNLVNEKSDLDFNLCP